MTLLFGTGKDYHEQVQSELIKLGIKEHDNIRVMPYISDMANTLTASNLIISRSGALSVAEITMSGRAAIFIPSPNVTGDHQYYNAKAVVDNGGAIIVTEDEDAGTRVINALSALIHDQRLLEEMEKGSLRTAPVNATGIIYKTIMKDFPMHA